MITVDEQFMILFEKWKKVRHLCRAAVVELVLLEGVPVIRAEYRGNPYLPFPTSISMSIFIDSIGSTLDAAVVELSQPLRLSHLKTIAEIAAMIYEDVDAMKDHLLDA